MNKFKMELTWHNCATCPPEEDYNPCLIYTNGDGIYDCTYYKEYGFPIKKDMLHEFWWADIIQTVSKTYKFKGAI